MAELKPCPFCGGRVRVAKSGDRGQYWWFVTRAVGTGKCTCRVFMESGCFYEGTPQYETQKLKQDLIEAWNRRDDNG